MLMKIRAEEMNFNKNKSKNLDTSHRCHDNPGNGVRYSISLLLYFYLVRKSLQIVNQSFI